MSYTCFLMMLRVTDMTMRYIETITFQKMANNLLINNNARHSSHLETGGEQSRDRNYSLTL